MGTTLDARLQQLEAKGWTYSVGYNKDYGGYYAQAWRPYKEPVYIGQDKLFAECLTCAGPTPEAAADTLCQRLMQLGELPAES
jgi:hypothetical protein